MEELKNGELETVPQNLFGINPVDRKRPYLSTPEAQATYTKFMGYERGVLVARIAELNSRADQIMYIWLCKQSGVYMAAAQKASENKTENGYFRDWLDELAAQGVAYGSRRKRYPGSNNYAGYTYRWDDIERVIDICLSKGLPIEIATKVASVGVKAVERYLKYGIISLDDVSEGKAALADTPLPEITSEEATDADVEDVEKEVRRAEEAKVLEELANATSSRDASMIAKSRVETTFTRISAINKDGESDMPGFDRYNIEVQEVTTLTGEYTPFESRYYVEKSMPMRSVKFVLSKLSESLARII